jgi:hypothetical protein
MAKTEMLCPFNGKLCDECAFYRGRHYYLSFCEHYRGYIGESRVKARPGADNHVLNIETFDRLLGPWSGRGKRVATEPDVRLKVIDMETGETRIAELSEARNWDWGDTNIIRMVDGFHITSWDKLLEILHYKAAKGYREVELYEGPRFMLLGGG